MNSNSNLYKFLETFYGVQISDVVSSKIKEMQKNLKQTFDLSDHELIEQLEVELLLTGITAKDKLLTFEFTQNEKLLGQLLIDFTTLTLTWSDQYLIEDETPLHSIKQVVTLLRQQLFNIEVK